MGQSKHILVVDDNGDVREVIVDILQEQNYRVSTASSGSVMRDFLETGDAVHCVILDALIARGPPRTRERRRTSLRAVEERSRSTTAFPARSLFAQLLCSGPMMSF